MHNNQVISLPSRKQTISSLGPNNAYLSRFLKDALSFKPFATTWSGTIGNGYMSSKFMLLGKVCIVSYYVYGGTTTTWPTTWTFTLPFAPWASGSTFDVHTLTGAVSTSTGEVPAIGDITSSSTFKALMLSSGSFGNIGSLSSGSYMTLSGFYEVD